MSEWVHSGIVVAGFVDLLKLKQRSNAATKTRSKILGMVLP